MTLLNRRLLSLPLPLLMSLLLLLVILSGCSNPNQYTYTLTESGLKDKTIIIISERNQSAIDTYGNNIIAKGQVTIRTSADYTNGIYAEGHKVQLGANSHLTIKGAFSRGIFSTHGTIVLNDNSHITTKGTEAIGLEAIKASQVTIGDRFALLTSGANAHGNVIADSSRLSLGQQAHIITQGVEAIACSTIASSTQFGNQAYIETFGKQATGLFAMTESQVLLADDIKIITRGQNAAAALIYDSQLRLGQRANLITYGERSPALLISSQHQSVTSGNIARLDVGNDSQLKTEGKNSTVIGVIDGSQATLGHNITIEASGKDACALLVKGNSTATFKGDAKISHLGHANRRSSNNLSSNGLPSKNSDTVCAIAAYDKGTQINANGCLIINGDIQVSNGAKVTLTLAERSQFVGQSSIKDPQETQGEISLTLNNAHWIITGQSDINHIGGTGALTIAPEAQLKVVDLAQGNYVLYLQEPVYLQKTRSELADEIAIPLIYVEKGSASFKLADVPAHAGYQLRKMPVNNAGNWWVLVKTAVAVSNPAE